MLKYHAVFFDLDGTIADSAPGILNSMQYALARFGLHPPVQALRRYLGPPLDQLFGDYLPQGQIEEAIALFRECYDAGELYNAKLYPGIPALLQRLQQAGVKPCLATAKQRAAALRVIEHFGLAPYFALVGGTVREEGVDSKTAVILKNMQDGGFAKGECLMVGDRRDDMLGAKAAGVDPLGVLYGYGSREELLPHQPVLLAETPAQVGDFVLGTAQ